MSESSLKEKSPKEAHDRLDAYHVIDVRFEHEVEGGPLGAVEGAERIDRVDLGNHGLEGPVGQLFQG